MAEQDERSGVDWVALSRGFFAIAFCVGVAMGIVNSQIRWFQPLPWRIVSLFMAVGLLLFPLMILALFRFHSWIGTGLQLEEPRLDRNFFSLMRPLDLMMFAARAAMWQGLGLVTMFWISWPENLVIGLGMILGCFSMWCGIRLVLATSLTDTQDEAKQSMGQV